MWTASSASNEFWTASPHNPRPKTRYTRSSATPTQISCNPPCNISARHTSKNSRLISCSPRLQSLCDDWNRRTSAAKAGLKMQDLGHGCRGPQIFSCSRTDPSAAGALRLNTEETLASEEANYRGVNDPARSGRVPLVCVLCKGCRFCVWFEPRIYPDEL